jgi:tricarballylate dehydrogenase
MGSPRVVVVGGGNAALCAALTAREAGVSVLVLERAPEKLRGGNTAFAGAAMRVAYNGVDDLRRLMPDLTDDEVENTDFGAYPLDAFLDDLARITEYRTDPDLAFTMVSESLPTLQWMSTRGIRFVPIYGRQAFKVDGKLKFWGGLTVEASGGGAGIIDTFSREALRQGIEIRYGARVVELIDNGGGIEGVRVREQGTIRDEPADAVVLASGGFQANAEWRTRYLGPGWDLAKVRGSRYDTGDGLRMALEAGASPAGNWSGAHAAAWDRNAPEFGDRSLGDHFQRHSYQFGIMVNADGRRFLDEGADFRNLTYAKYGRVILQQPGQFAWQVFDQQVTQLLKEEYRGTRVTKVTGATLAELAKKMDGVNPAQFLDEVAEYNAAVQDSVPFEPAVKDARGTRGLRINKSNWANRLEVGPFEAYAVTCGVTFTFGGVRINTRAQVLDVEHAPIPRLFAAGEMVGGVFYFNYPGGSGLTNGAVFGRIAGRSAAECALGGTSRPDAAQ